jgi:hypothetical protein
VERSGVPNGMDGFGRGGQLAAAIAGVNWRVDRRAAVCR